MHARDRGMLPRHGVACEGWVTCSGKHRVIAFPVLLDLHRKLLSVGVERARVVDWRGMLIGTYRAAFVLRSAFTTMPFLLKGRPLNFMAVAFPGSAATSVASCRSPAGGDAHDHEGRRGEDHSCEPSIVRIPSPAGRQGWGLRSGDLPGMKRCRKPLAATLRRCDV